MNWRDHITSSPEVLGGEPVVRGTRLAVEFLLGLSAAGWSEAQILANYPSVSADALRGVYGYAAEAISEDTLYQVNRLAG